MDDLFYSSKEGILFWVAGYTDNSSKVDSIVKSLTENANKLTSLIQEGREKINTFFVYDSRRYKNMRVFYVETKTIPESAFRISDGWTMDKWIRN